MPADGTQGPGNTDNPGGPANDGQDFDYTRAYNELRPEFTRTTQELSAAQAALTDYEQLFAALQDPEHQAEALAALGFEPADTSTPQRDDNEFVDPLEEQVQALQQQLAEVQQSTTAQQEAAREAEMVEMRDSYIGDAISFIEDQTGQQFSEKEEEVLGNLAVAMESEDGVPDVQGAYEAIYGDEGVLETRRASWIESKQRAQLPPLGQPIPEDRRPATRSDRVTYIDERLRALDEQR